MNGAVAFCLAIAAIFVGIVVAEAWSDRAEQETIQACINAGREPVVSYGGLKECKR